MTHVNRNIVYTDAKGSHYSVCIEDHVGDHIVVIDAQTGERVTLTPADDWQLVRETT